MSWRDRHGTRGGGPEDEDPAKRRGYHHGNLREALIKAAFIAAAALATLVNTFVSKSAILVALGLFLALLGVILERTQWLRLEKR